MLPSATTRSSSTRFCSRPADPAHIEPDGYRVGVTELFPAPTSTRVVRGFAFIDLSGFTSFTDTEGDAAAVDVLTSFRSIVRGVASTRGVRIAKWLGDGAMLVGVEPAPMLEAVVEIAQMMTESGAPLALRAGFTSGPVILIDGDDYIGHAVNLAARLCAEAAPYEVLALAADVNSLHLGVDLVQAGSRVIPGVEDPVDVVTVEPR